MQVRTLFLCLGLILGAEGCAKVKAAVCADMVAAPKPGATGKPGGAAGAPAPDADDSKPEASDETTTLTSEARPSGPAQDQFALPFAWEKSPDEPLSKTRTYLREMARDNAAYMRRGPAAGKPLENPESPRATVLSCADARVQPGVWDATPENDAFTVRNLGNQVGPGLGAIQYGVDTLNTPLLMILGHTGCSAIKAALTGTSKLSEPVRHELASLKVARKKPKKLDDKYLAQAAVDNVNDQVERALGQFAARVNSGQLTIIGAVYDSRNDLGGGVGKMSIVNVNGITEAARLKAFHEAVLAGANLAASGKRVDPFERLSEVFAEHLRVQDAEDEDEEETPAPPSAARALTPNPPPVPTAPAASKPEEHGATEPAHGEPGPGAIPASAAKPHH
jgi:carbonic anhydrase